MFIKVKNFQLNPDAIEALNSLIEMDINAISAFKLTRIIKEISSIVEDKMKLEKKILDKWIEKGLDGNPIIPKDNDGNPVQGAVSLTDVNAFTQEMNDLMNIENTLTQETIKFEDLNLSTAKVKDLMKLDFLFN